MQFLWMIGLVGLGCAITLWEPIIGGSGLPQLIAELNGAKIPLLLDVKTLVLKATHLANV